MYVHTHTVHKYKNTKRKRYLLPEKLRDLWAKVTYKHTKATVK